MIEGLRVLPWFQDARRKNPDGMSLLSNCDECQRREPVQVRERMGCGYLPPSEHARPWAHPSYGEKVKHCPGYVCKLPEVIEVARARRHWRNGELRSFAHGQPSDDLMALVEVHDVSASDLEAHLAKPKDGPP